MKRAAAATGRWSAVSHQHVFCTNHLRLQTVGRPRYTTNTEDIMDVAIVGGGMVGTALACSLGSAPLTQSLRIALIEEGKLYPTTQNQPPYPDLRVSAISPASMRLLKGIGAWDSLPENRIAPFDTMKVWETGSAASIQFNSGEAGEERLGYIVENNLLVTALVQKIDSLPCIKTFAPATLSSIKFPMMDNTEPADSDSHSYQWASGCPWITLTLENGQHLRTRLVVAADGKNSFVRKKANFPALSWAYYQRAVVASVELEHSTTTAWQRFLPSGPIALLPMFDNYGSVVWSTSPRHAAYLQNLDPSEFVGQLNSALHSPPSSIPEWLSPLAKTFAPFLPDTPKPPMVLKLQPSKRASFPLSISHTIEYTRPRAVLIGDAAHTVHPLAGQGVNLGFADVASLTEVLNKAVEAGSDIGDITILKQYEENRKWRNGLMLAGVDGLKRLFDSRLLPIAAARGIGIALTNRVPFLKREILEYASEC